MTSYCPRCFQYWMHAFTDRPTHHSAGALTATPG